MTLNEAIGLFAALFPITVLAIGLYVIFKQRKARRRPMLTLVRPDAEELRKMDALSNRFTQLNSEAFRDEAADTESVKNVKRMVRKAKGKKRKGSKKK